MDNMWTKACGLHVVVFADNIVDLCKTKYSKFVVKSLLKYW